MLNKITLFENGSFEVVEIQVLNTKNKNGENSGIWKTSVGAMKVSGFEKANYDRKANCYYIHTCKEPYISMSILKQAAVVRLQGLVTGYKNQNKTERANIYKRTKSLKKANNDLEIMRRVSINDDNSM